MLESIEHLAADILEVAAWAPENQAVPEHHITQIVQTALNMPTGINHGKGTFTMIPHRMSDFDRYKNIMTNIGCNIDTTLNHCHTALVFGICQNQLDSTYTPPADDHWHQEHATRKRWWADCHTRCDEFNTPFGDLMPTWLRTQVVINSMALTGAAMEARRLGYYVQFLTVDRLSPLFWSAYPHMMSQPWIPMHVINLGTHPLRIKHTHQRNRSHAWVTDQSDVIVADQVPVDQPLLHEYDDTIMTPTDHQPYRSTYQTTS